MKVTLDVNGEQYDVENCTPATSLAQVLRDVLDLTGTKRGCDSGGCGMCTVLLDGKAIYSCMTPCWKAEGKRVTTVEGISKGGVLDPLQEAFARNFAPQCGYCTSAMLLSAKSFLDSLNDRKEIVSDENIMDALCGVLCRCTGYLPYIESVKQVVETRAKQTQPR